MSQTTAVRTRTRRTVRPIAVGLAIVTVAVIGAIANQAVPTLLHGGGSKAAVVDGGLPAGVTVFDTKYPGVTNLDPALLRALRKAATDAAGNHLEFYVNSGWRSPKYQEQLRREAVSKYGSEQEAARWVGTPQTSPHVAGNAVDIGHPNAAAWLSQHGSKYGLCQIYRNEAWHYELRPQAIAHGCPAPYADPTQDPRTAK
jgi:hypothetical protein